MLSGETGHTQPGSSRALADARWSWTADSFEVAVAAGAFGLEAQVELFEGEVLELAPMPPGHAQAVGVLIRQSHLIDGSRWTFNAQVPIRLGERSEPEPDAWIARGPLARYAQRHPDEKDLVLLIEISDTSIAMDRDVKVPGYAAAGVEEVWLVSLPEQLATVYRRPVRSERRFGQVRTLGPDETATHSGTGFSVALRDLLPIL